MGVTTISKEAKGASAVYMCVLCGSVFSSSDYQWGGCEGNETRVSAPCANWSCPVCEGVVVEYDRIPEGEPPTARAALG